MTFTAFTPFTGKLLFTAFTTNNAIPPGGRVKNTKRKGNRNEHRSMVILEAAGYACTRSAASLGAFDIVGIGSTDVVLVQVKTRDWPGAAEVEVMKLLPAPPNCRKLVHRWRERQRVPDVREV